MVKATSPIRLQEELMQSATAAGQRMHRSAAEQVEYWASIGRSVAGVVDPDKLLAISAGLAQLKVIPVEPPAINPDDVFAALEQERKSGTLTASITSAEVRYQASVTHPGQLEQVSADGSMIVGQFSMGTFTPLTKG